MAWRPAGQLDGLQMFETAARFAALLSRITSHHITSHHMSHAQHDEREIVLTHCRVQPPRRRPPTSKTTTKRFKKKVDGCSLHGRDHLYMYQHNNDKNGFKKKNIHTHTHTSKLIRRFHAVYPRLRYPQDRRINLREIPRHVRRGQAEHHRCRPQPRPPRRSKGPPQQQAEVVCLSGS